MRIAIATFLIVIVVVGSARAEDCSFPDAVPLSGEATSAAEMRVAFLSFARSFAGIPDRGQGDARSRLRKPLGGTGDPFGLCLSGQRSIREIHSRLMGWAQMKSVEVRVAIPSAGM